MHGCIVFVMVVGIVMHEWLIDKAHGWLSGKNKCCARIEPPACVQKTYIMKFYLIHQKSYICFSQQCYRISHTSLNGELIKIMYDHCHCDHLNCNNPNHHKGKGDSCDENHHRSTTMITTMTTKMATKMMTLTNVGPRQQQQPLNDNIDNDRNSSNDHDKDGHNHNHYNLDHDNSDHNHNTGQDPDHNDHNHNHGSTTMTATATMMAASLTGGYHNNDRGSYDDDEGEWWMALAMMKEWGAAPCIVLY